MGTQDDPDRRRPADEEPDFARGLAGDGPGQARPLQPGEEELPDSPEKDAQGALQHGRGGASRLTREGARGALQRRQRARLDQRVTVNLVIVSHSAQLAEGTAELARQMGGDEVAIEPAGGLEDGSIGTDAERVRAAIERVRSPAGVLVLMDLGSALMSAEIALELLEDSGGPVVLSAAPLVEGAVAAAARARGGAALAEVAAEARGALVMKTSQLEEQDAPAAPAPEVPDTEGLVERLHVGNRLGLHLRPAGRIIELVAAHDATVEIRNATRGTGPADGRSVTGLAMLRAVHGDELEVSARGPEAQALLAALAALAAGNFGDAPDARPRGRGTRPRAARAPGHPRGGAARRDRGARPGDRAGALVEARGVRPRGRRRRSAGGGGAAAVRRSGRRARSARRDRGATARGRGRDLRGAVAAARGRRADRPRPGRGRGRRAGGARVQAGGRRGRRRLRRRGGSPPPCAGDRRP